MKSNIYYKKDKKIRVVTKTTTFDQYGNEIESYRYLTGEIWAYTNQLSQSQVFEASQYGHDETRIFVLNFRDDLHLYDIIEYKEKYYTITRIDTRDDYRTELFVYVQDCPKGDTPHEIRP